VRAAGGVVWRRGPGGRGPEVLLVHRPKYDDWSLPKGKAEAGESDEDAAVREVEEETGLRCPLGRELPSTSYVGPDGRPKVVRYWAMEAGFGDGADGANGAIGAVAAGRAQKEVDELRWLPVGDAEELLSYERDREVLAALFENG
jgi:8-oxo-dGTP diphosphatase